MQDEIVASLASQLGAQLVASEARRAERAPNPDAMDLYFQGLAWFNKGTTRETLTQARGFFDRALALDPGNVDALVGAASVDHQVVANYIVDDRSARLAAAEAALTKVLSLAPDNALGHLRMGNVLVNTNRGAQAKAEFERALALDPNLADAHAYIGFALLVNGHAEETESHVLEALRLSPRDTNAYIWLGQLAAAKLYLGADEDAVGLYRRAIEINPNRPVLHFYLAAALEELGRVDEARAEVQAGLAIEPSFTVRRFRTGALSDNPVYLKQRERVIEAMREAGIPEG